MSEPGSNSGKSTPRGEQHLDPLAAQCAKIESKTHLIAYSSQIPTYMKRNDMIVY